MFKKRMRHDHHSPKQTEENITYPTEYVSIERLRKAIHNYGDQLPKGIPLQIIINEDRTINYSLLGPFLKAIPKDPYYMSRETYEIFEEKDKELAIELDMVQVAVDNYIQQMKELPIIEGDPYRKVSFFKLEKLDLIEKRPDRDYFISRDEHLVTFRHPKTG